MNEARNERSRSRSIIVRLRMQASILYINHSKHDVHSCFKVFKWPHVEVFHVGHVLDASVVHYDVNPTASKFRLE